MIPQKISQCKRILAYMQGHGSITPLEALEYCGSFRLSARIKNLRDAGYTITVLHDPTRWVNQNSQKTQARTQSAGFTAKDIAAMKAQLRAELKAELKAEMEAEKKAKKNSKKKA